MFGIFSTFRGNTGSTFTPTDYATDPQISDPEDAIRMDGECPRVDDGIWQT